MAFSAVALRSMTKPGTFADGEGLYLQVRGPENRSWLFRYKRAGKTHWMGLGTVADVSLAQAREAARAARKLLLAGTDPLEARQRQQANAEEARRLTFDDVAARFIAAHEAGWRNPKHRQQWANTLAAYASPVIGKRPVANISTADVMHVLDPVWHRAPETATRLRGRIEAVLDYAAARGQRSGENPARWRGHLANLLPARMKIAKTVHHPALPWQQIGAFMVELRQQSGMAAMALRFTILTAARSGETLGARWSEIDLAEAVWVVPARRMKAGREHRVPLTEAAMEVLRQAAEVRTDDSPNAFVFPSAKPGRPLSDMTVTMMLRRMNVVAEGQPKPWIDPRTGEGVTTHGFRSTFRDWASEATNFDHATAEAALAHTVRDKVEAAYRRGDLFSKRRRLMEAWAAFCASPAAKAAEVISFRASA